MHPAVSIGELAFVNEEAHVDNTLEDGILDLVEWDDFGYAAGLVEP